MKQVQRGFTLIELVMVIVILGVLAAVAIPKFVDLK
ncbi:MAG: prepilin-type N-terminal cleavage/methylation domain-containing protein, partial [Rhodoferax sp.]|nr:prepilin-type N-terminal cleavage/methylation domain-containing protein [Rhodoferax sp.]